MIYYYILDDYSFEPRIFSFKNFNNACEYAKKLLFEKYLKDNKYLFTTFKTYANKNEITKIYVRGKPEIKYEAAAVKLVIEYPKIKKVIYEEKYIPEVKKEGKIYIPVKKIKKVLYKDKKWKDAYMIADIDGKIVEYLVDKDFKERIFHKKIRIQEYVVDIVYIHREEIKFLDEE